MLATIMNAISVQGGRLSALNITQIAEPYIGAGKTQKKAACYSLWHGNPFPTDSVALSKGVKC